MHYIRFFKTPKLVVNGPTSTLKATISITSDLGDSFYPNDVTLSVTLRSGDSSGDIYLRKSTKWTAGSRAVPLEFALTDTDIDWPARVHVGLKSSPMLDHFEKRHNTAGDLPSIINVWSDMLSPEEGIFEAKRLVERRFMPLSNRMLCLWEETGDSIARHLWDGGLALTAYFDRVVSLQEHESMPMLVRTLVSATYKKLNVIELGCGCGAVGIGLAQLIPDLDVTLTDVPEVEDIVRKNIDAMTPAISCKVRFEPLDWEAPLSPAIRDKWFGMIIVAECTYNTNSIPLLVQTLSALVSRSPKAIVVLATKVRHPDEALFHKLLKDAGFRQNSHVSIPLPTEPESHPEKADLYIFHGKDGASSNEVLSDFIVSSSH
ncbi:hypothetical protein LTR16_001164 [Cryomyces antarcticus]|uniref:Uncharacterized protein n=1 Tax=Cryomyces antarcticus TaxID=329879 RepID=A0ABR0LQE4_9PEZI|nr:hypothetical protein LTR16_001164 [Cryomyces antarcticus]